MLDSLLLPWKFPLFLCLFPFLDLHIVASSLYPASVTGFLHSSCCFIFSFGCCHFFLLHVLWPFLILIACWPFCFNFKCQLCLLIPFVFNFKRLNRATTTEVIYYQHEGKAKADWSLASFILLMESTGKGVYR